jgi:hypothetical protein
MKDTGFGRIVAVLISPSKTFRAIAERPTWLAPILVLIVLSAVSASIAAPKIDWQDTIDTKLQRADREVGPERIAIVLSFVEQIGTGLMLGTAVLLPWIIFPLLALIFLGLLKTIGGELSFRTSLGVLVHGFMPWAVATLLSIPILLTRESLDLYDPGFMTPNLAAFADPETGLELWILLNSVDLFSLWTIALLVIGYGIAAKTTKVRAAACVVGLWAIWIAFLVGLAALE